MRKKKTSTLPTASDNWWKASYPPSIGARRTMRRVAHSAHKAAGVKAPTLVYFVRAENGLVKIGTAFDLAIRLGELRRMSPVPLELLAHVEGQHTRKFEYALHRRFSGERAHGEWFRVDIDRLAFACDRAVEAGWKIRLVRKEGE